MARNVSSPDAADGSWNPGSPEAQALAEALRSCRLTLLVGEAGAGKSALLSDGVMPLLRRRAGDAIVRAARGEPQVILPFPERRSRACAQLAEIVIFFDAWNDAPLNGLHDRIDAALREAQVEPDAYRGSLPERVYALGARFGTRFLFVFDRVEELLNAASGADQYGKLQDELVHLLNQRLPANALMTLRSDAQAVFEPFGDRFYSVEIEVLHLSHWRTAAPEQPAPHLHAVEVAPAPLAPADEGAPPHPSADVPAAPSTHPGDIYASIERTLARTSVMQPPPASTGRDDWPAPVRVIEVSRRPVAPPTSSAEWSAPADEPRVPIGVAPPPRSKRQRMLLWMLLPLASLALIFIGLRFGGPDESSAEPPPADAVPSAAAIGSRLVVVDPAPSPSSPPPRLPSPTPPIAVAAPALPSLELVVEGDAGAPARLPAELARSLAADKGGVALRIRTGSGGFSSLVGGPTSQRLAIVRYDALQAAARGSAKPALAVVAPLYTEEIYVVARADSPLQYIHQIEGRRIDVGPAQGGRALTAATLYRRMFGKPLPPAPGRAQDTAAALQTLVAGKALDAVVLVAPQPASALAALSPQARRGIKLLRLDPAHPASQKALQSYLPATLSPARGAGDAPTPTLAAMAFLVTTGATDGGQSDTLGRLAESLCRNLPELQRIGDAKWREVRPGLQLETGWPSAAGAEAAWSACGSAAADIAAAAPRR